GHAALPLLGHRDGRHLQHRGLQRRHPGVPVDSGAPRSGAAGRRDVPRGPRRPPRRHARRRARDDARAQLRAGETHVPALAASRTIATRVRTPPSPRRAPAVRLPSPVSRSRLLAPPVASASPFPVPSFPCPWGGPLTASGRSVTMRPAHPARKRGPFVARRARNQEVIRQWTLLRDLWERRYGRTVDELAELLGVSTRTVRRDLAA